MKGNPRMRRPLALLAIVAAVTLSGCSRPANPGAQQPAPPPAEAASAPAVAPAGSPMPLSKRQGELPKGLPLEVPVVDGTVLRALDQTREGGLGVWLYDVETTNTADATASWYRNAYAQAAWTPTDDARREGGTTELAFRKGEGAESRIRFVPVEGGSRVEATVGLGSGISVSY